MLASVNRKFSVTFADDWHTDGDTDDRGHLGARISVGGLGYFGVEQT